MRLVRMVVLGCKKAVRRDVLTNKSLSMRQKQRLWILKDI